RVNCPSRHVSAIIASDDEDEEAVSFGPSSTVSGLWEHFEQVDKALVEDGQKPPAKCTVHVGKGKNGNVIKCGHVCKRTKGNTASMRSHLKTNHPFIYADYLQKSLGNKKKSAPQKSTQPKSNNLTATSKAVQSTLSFTNLDKKVIEQCSLGAAYFLASQCLPYSIVDSDGFRKFVDILRPGLGRSLPGRRAMTENYVPRLDLGIPIIKCLAHSLQLGIDKVYVHEIIKPLVKKVKQILNTINASPSLRNDMFQTAKAMDRECVEIPLTCKTRWWTFLRTAVAVNRNLPQLRVVFAKERRGADRSKRSVTYAHLTPTPQEEEILQLLIQVLTPLQEITEDLSSESYVTGSAILPLVNIIDQILCNAVEQVEKESINFEEEEKESSNINDLNRVQLIKDLADIIKISLLD
ncbi:E3 SUMO-protein ligase ZBED1, partial [Frankliniella fusca]